MSSIARTNQLLYQVELLLALAEDARMASPDEHAVARRMALEEAALGQLELALNALLREVTGHTDLSHAGWRGWLSDSTAGVAELERLRGLAAHPDSWLAVLIARLEDLNGDDGAARRDARSGLIASAGAAPLSETLRWCHRELKSLLPALREGSREW